MINKAHAPARALFDGMSPVIIAAAFVFALAPASVHAQTATDTVTPAPGSESSASTSPEDTGAKPATSDKAAAGADVTDEAHPGANAKIVQSDGTDIGSASLTETPSRFILFQAELKGLPAGGNHAIHIHETGKCDGPDFKSAGGHFAAGKQHGILDAAGPHPGDLPNFTVGADGTARIEVFMSGFTLADVLDDDGSAVVIHSGTDDYKSQPAGDAGDRIACGVIEGK